MCQHLWQFKSFFVKTTFGKDLTIYLLGSQCDHSRCVMENSELGALQPLGFGHMTAHCSWPIHCWQAGQVATREGGTERKIVGKVLA